jgi:cytochrome c-type biogenesis protein CcmH
MVLWFVFALLTVAATVAVLWPIARARRIGTLVSPEAHDLAVYRDQLDELERDRERGLIAEREADAARTEIARRALRAAEAGPESKAGRTLARPVAVAAVVAIPLAALGLYTWLGSPGLPALPLEARLAAADENDVPAMIAKVERHLAAAPDDVEGWRVIAPVYASLGRFDDAARALRRVAALEGPSPELAENIGEMLVAANDGVVGPDAAAAFDEALSVEPTRVKALFYRALGHAQAGRRDAAIADYDAVLRLSPPDAPWIEQVRADRAALLSAPEQPAPGPDAADVAAAADMSEADRAAMIAGMVEGLAARLADDPDDAEGWQRLIRAYGVMGRADDAAAAWRSAAAAFADSPDDLARIRAVADEAGVATN